MSNILDQASRKKKQIYREGGDQSWSKIWERGYGLAANTPINHIGKDRTVVFIELNVMMSQNLKYVNKMLFSVWESG
jgi:hypothetical protein